MRNKITFRKSISFVLTFVMVISMFTVVMTNDIQAFEVGSNISMYKTLSENTMAIDTTNPDNNIVTIDYKISLPPISVLEIPNLFTIISVTVISISCLFILQQCFVSFAIVSTS